MPMVRAPDRVHLQCRRVGDNQVQQPRIVVRIIGRRPKPRRRAVGDACRRVYLMRACMQRGGAPSRRGEGVCRDHAAIA